MRPLGPAAVVLGCALAVAALCLGVGWFVRAVAGVDVPLVAVAVTGGLLGVMAAPPVRLPLERRDAQGRGAPILLAGAGLTVALVTLLGLGVLATVGALGVVAHGVQVRPTRGQTVYSCCLVAVLSLASLGVQLAGWVPSVVEPRQALPLMVVAVVMLSPQVLNIASISRRAQEAARALEAARREHVEQLEEAALHDPLTGLLSRRGLAAPLTCAAASAQPGALSAVLFVDLDGFKAVNDTHGHAAGDELLREVGRRFGEVVGGAVARTGGDEFVVVQTGLDDPGRARSTAAALHAVLTRPVRLRSGAEVVVGASVGVAVSSAPCTVDDLLAQADADMYRVKHASRARRAGDRGAAVPSSSRGA